ncbi:PREDICTED: DNA topoisomerase 2-alpha-like [Priapulus caudatus]|uniref:DNA topoisomerase (ATP-hydrolyzing) n=1 Tax=Priapulus caudatus TaxID=37621 RepID=A0ABM1DTS0_PRICU|nr:PREDICTED: DNA topoisomerase 2-alpha-like [Priapulus caudatus]XP_014663341.1 PREDICTED: DNA topoisomerase 2-alpha-like [Priapulus caudatus]XP_014663342.1 PREDICTED: DNA topoisomerase 2-alpha-like [Priapulus caudatus]XP_014663343.1 PREDICTED: DNA topoisomerase 2-alpha-like [Priapulus caudatus]
MEMLDADTVALFSRRAYNIAAATPGVKVMLNRNRLPVKNFQDYVLLYTKGRASEDGTDLKVCNERVNDRWEVAVALSEKGFQQVSFGNSIPTTKARRHVDYVGDQLVSKLMVVVKKKNKGGVNVKPFQVKSHMWLFVNCLLENPACDSQT